MLKPQQFIKVLLVLLLSVAVWSCKTTSDPTPVADKNLVASTLISESTKAQLQDRLAAISPLAAQLAQYGVKAYRITYKTKNWDGTDIVASGALIVPTTTTAVAMASQQHGTIRTDAEAPSYFGTGSEAYFTGSLFASVGFIIACPDYIGYGESKNVAHPYEHRKTLAQASLDMIRASKEFVSKNTDIKWDGRLYVTGYSQGGFATMSLQKMIEEETGTEFNLRASSCGAGAYNKTATMKNLITQSTSNIVSNNALYAWVLQTYNTVYKIGRPMSFYFKEPYATQVQTSALTSNINIAFGKSLTDSFVKSITDGTDATFATAVADNDVFDWKPITPTRLYHGDADELVPFLNSQTAFDAMKKRGATSVELYKLAGRTHATGVQDYLLGTYEMFTTVK